jgi:hypothetical protein
LSFGDVDIELIYPSRVEKLLLHVGPHEAHHFIASNSLRLAHGFIQIADKAENKQLRASQR